MSNVSRTRKPYYYLGGAGGILLFLPLVMNDHLLTVAITGLMWAYLCLSWNLVFGFAGQFSLGHALFWGIGAYTSTVLFVNYGLTPWVGIFVGGFLSAIAAWLISLVVLRYRVKGVYFALMTLAFAEVFTGLALNWDYIRGPVGILLPMKNSPGNLFFIARAPYYYFILGLLCLGLGVTYGIQKSKLGYYLKAVREDEEAAEVSGVPSSRYKILAMIISAFLTALGGTFYAQFFLYISPEIMFGFGSQMTMMIGTMVGGAGTLLGPVLGSLVFSFLGELLRSLPLAHSREIVTVERMIWALVLVVVIFYLPGGLVTLGDRVKSRKGRPGTS